MSELETQTNTAEGQSELTAVVMRDFQWPWISVNDQLPEFTKQNDASTVNGVRCHAYEQSERCLVIVDGNVTDSVLLHNFETDNCYWSMLSGDVTHWMPYPSTNGA